MVISDCWSARELDKEPGKSRQPGGSLRFEQEAMK
jgi:hypothetical protein